MIARLLERLKRRLAWDRAEPPAVAHEEITPESHVDAVRSAATADEVASADTASPDDVASRDDVASPDAAASADDAATDDAPTLVDELTAAAEPPDPERPREAIVPPAHAGVVLRLESARAETVNFEVTRTGATLGRAADNGIRLDDLSVSRKHARIAYRQGAYWLSDVGSVGGTWVDGTKLNAPRRLAAGQVIDIGVCRLTVVSLAGTPSEPARKRS